MRERIIQNVYCAASGSVDAACQILAALLAGEDTAKILAPEDPDEFLSWAADLRKDISEQRAELAAAVAHQGFSRNSHLGFSLGNLAGNPSHSHYTLKVAETFASWLEEQTYESLPRIADLGGHDAACEVIADKLIERGFHMTGYKVEIARETVVKTLQVINASAFYAEARCDLLFSQLRAGRELHADDKE